MKKFACAFLFATLALLIGSTLVSAGGWAVVTLDQVPSQVIAGQPISIGFMVRQHGRTPINGLSPKITATRADTNDSFNAVAVQQGAVGHYVAMLTFPNAGAWNWAINAFGFEQPMPALTVLASPAAKNATTTANAPAPFPIPLATVLVGLIGACIALAIWLRAQKRWAIAVVVIAAVVFGFGLALMVNQTTTSATQMGNQTTTSAPQIARDTPQAEVGKSLFLAKGCIVCHQYAEVNDARKNFSDFSVGPNLTNLKADPAYLHRWLKDPSAVKPGTEMPTLGLSDEEINALVAFLTKPK